MDIEYKFISHRGNIGGSIPEKENDPQYVLTTLHHGFDVEVDVWYGEYNSTTDSHWWLGHDKPVYPISEEFLYYSNLWLHIKNLEAVDIICRSPNTYYFKWFWHQTDTITIVNDRSRYFDCNNEPFIYMWTYPGKALYKNSIAVLPESTGLTLDFPYKELSPFFSCAGVCSDHIGDFKQRFIEAIIIDNSKSLKFLQNMDVIINEDGTVVLSKQNNKPSILDTHVFNNPNSKLHFD